MRSHFWQQFGIRIFGTNKQDGPIFFSFDPSPKFFQALSIRFEAIDGAFLVRVTQGDSYHYHFVLRDIKGIFYLVFKSGDETNRAGCESACMSSKMEI